MATTILIVITVGLVSIYASQEDLGQVAYIKSGTTSVSIRSNPNATSRVVSIIEGGTQVNIVQIIESRDVLWAQVNENDTIGWLPYTYLSQNPQ